MAKIATFEIQYGKDRVPVNIPGNNILDEVGMNVVEPAKNHLEVIERSLDSPIGSRPLLEIAGGMQRVVILVDDITRPTPVYKLMPSILNRFERAGVASNNICILVATGTHRPMTDQELADKIGSETLDKYRVVNHDYRIGSEQVSLGTTSSGIPITVNRLVAEADFVLAIGNIVPHRYCGWAGGAKIIQPGVGGEPTTAGTHLMITKDPDARLGVVENQVRHEIESVADKVNLKFIVNTILDRYSNIVDVVAGDFRQAFRVGVEIAKKVYSAKVSGQADIVLASAYPSDINLWQAGKAFYSADLIVRDGGIIILASPCYEGVGEHKEFVDLLSYRYSRIEKMIESGKVKDRISAAAALAVALVSERADIWLVSNTITSDEASRMNMRRFESIQMAITEALKEKGEDALVTILHEATEVLPIFGQ